MASGERVLAWALEKRKEGIPRRLILKAIAMQRAEIAATSDKRFGALRRIIASSGTPWLQLNAAIHSEKMDEVRSQHARSIERAEESRRIFRELETHIFSTHPEGSENRTFFREVLSKIHLINDEEIRTQVCELCLNHLRAAGAQEEQARMDWRAETSATLTPENLHTRITEASTDAERAYYQVIADVLNIRTEGVKEESPLQKEQRAVLESRGMSPEDILAYFALFKKEEKTMTEDERKLVRRIEVIFGEDTFSPEEREILEEATQEGIITPKELELIYVNRKHPRFDKPNAYIGERGKPSVTLCERLLEVSPVLKKELEILTAEAPKYGHDGEWLQQYKRARFTTAVRAMVPVDIWNLANEGQDYVRMKPILDALESENPGVAELIRRAVIDKNLTPRDVIQYPSLQNKDASPVHRIIEKYKHDAEEANEMRTRENLALDTLVADYFPDAGIQADMIGFDNQETRRVNAGAIKVVYETVGETDVHERLKQASAYGRDFAIVFRTTPSALLEQRGWLLWNVAHFLSVDDGTNISFDDACVALEDIMVGKELARKFEEDREKLTTFIRVILVPLCKSDVMRVSCTQIITQLEHPNEEALREIGASIRTIFKHIDI